MKFTFSASIAAKSWIRSRRASQSLSSFSSLLSIRNHSTFNIPPRAYPYYKSMIIRSKSYSRIRGYSSRHSSNTTINPSGSKIDQQSKKPRSKTTNSILHIIAWFPVFLFLTSHVYSVGQVHGSSMSPTLNPKPQPGERPSSSIVCLDRWSARINHLKVGDIVTLISPLHPSQLLTKRILALPGDVIRVPTPNSSSSSSKPIFTRIKIPDGHAWVEGDSSSNERTGIGKSGGSLADKSRDSREFGPVPLGLVTSRISFVLWPLHRFGFPLQRPTSNFKSDSSSYSSASEVDSRAQELLSLEVNKALDEAYLNPNDSVDRSELIASNKSSSLQTNEASNGEGKGKKHRVPAIQPDDGEEEVYEVDSILSPYTRDRNYVKGDSKSTSGSLGWGRKATEQELEREKAERRRESLNKWSRGGKLGE